MGMKTLRSQRAALTGSPGTPLACREEILWACLLATGAFFILFFSHHSSRREFRQAGLVSGLINLPSPFTFSLEFVNDCEKKCLRTQGCSFYEFDCKLSVCTLKRLDTTQESKFVQNDRYITGTTLLIIIMLIIMLLIIMMMMMVIKNVGRNLLHQMY